EPLPIDIPDPEHQRGGLDHAVTGAALLPGHAASRCDVAIAAGVDDHVGLDDLAARLVLHHHPDDAVAPPEHIHGLGVQHQPDAGLPEELHRQTLELVAVQRYRRATD